MTRQSVKSIEKDANAGSAAAVTNPLLPKLLDAQEYIVLHAKDQLEKYVQKAMRQAKCRRSFPLEF